MSHALVEKLPDLTSDWSEEDWKLVEEMLQREEEMAKANPLSYGMTPHEGQERMHMSLAKTRLLIAANRWGKTIALCREIAWRATDTHPYRPSQPIETIWLGSPTRKFSKQVHLTYLLNWLPKASLVAFNQEDLRLDVRRSDGGICQIYLMSYEMGRGKWQGSKVQVIGLDEESPEDIYREAYARLIESDGDMLLTLTPVSGMGWIYDRLYLPARKEEDEGVDPDEREIDLITGALAEYDPTAEFGVGRVKVPHMTYKKVLRFAKSIGDEDERAIRVFGEFRARSGTVYKGWDQDWHVIPAFAVPEHWYVYAAGDCGWHNFTTLFVAVAPDGRRYIVDEYISQQQVAFERVKAVWAKFQKMRSAEYLEELKQKNKTDWLTVWMDPAGASEIAELNHYADEYGVPVNFVPLPQEKKDVDAGIMKVQEEVMPLNIRPKPDVVEREGWSLGEPGFYVFSGIRSTWKMTSGDDVETVEDCRLRWEFTRYLWKRATPRDPNPRGIDKNSAGGGHMMDALRYAIMAPYTIPEETGDNKYRGLTTLEASVLKEQEEIAALKLLAEKEAVGEDRRWVIDEDTYDYP